jgi:rhodanese-related sulfurtransferase
MTRVHPLFTMNVKLGLLAAALASLALVAGKSHESRGVTIDPKQLSFVIQNELDHVTAAELADWIMQQRNDFRTIDLRDAQAFNEYHIPGAINLSMPALVGTNLDKHQAIVLYSEGGVHSAQALFLLWAQGYTKAYMLKGGLAEWNDTVLHPEITLSPGSKAAADSLRAVRRRSEYFGGTAVTQRPKTPQVPLRSREREKMRDEC